MSVRARTTPQCIPSFRRFRKTSWIVSGGPPGRNFGWQSRLGSKGRTTVDDGKEGWENSRQSNRKQSTGPRSQWPKTPSQQRPGQSRHRFSGCRASPPVGGHRAQPCLDALDSVGCAGKRVEQCVFQLLAHPRWNLEVNGHRQDRPADEVSCSRGHRDVHDFAVTEAQVA